MPLLDLPYAPRIHVPIEPNMKRGVVRIFFANDLGQRCCIDGRPMGRAAAIRLATQVIRSGFEAEVLAWRFNGCRPPDWRVHRCRRLDDAPAVLVDAVSGV